MACCTASPWPLPDGAPGAWVETEPDPCRSGIHACRLGDLPYWAGHVLYEIELDGEVTEHKTEAADVEAYDAERARHAEWIADRLQLVH